MELNLEFVIDEMNSHVGQSVSVFIEMLFFGSKTIEMEIDHASIAEFGDAFTGCVNRPESHI